MAHRTARALNTSRPLTHVYIHDDLLACGKIMTTDNWIIYPEYHHREVTCKRCLKALEKEKAND
jgi:hypothetical protein